MELEFASLTARSLLSRDGTVEYSSHSDGANLYDGFWKETLND